MTKREAAILSAFTGLLIGSFLDMHKYIEEIMRRPVFTHELANEEIVAEIKEKSRHDFMKLNEDIKD